MKKISVGLLIGMLICPMALASAEEITTNSSHFDEILTSTSIEDKIITSESEELFEAATEYTEAVEITESSSEKELNKTNLDEMSEDEILKYIEELAMKATTPEEYQEVLEYIKKYTDYDQSEKESDIESFSERSYSNRAAQKIGVAEFLGINKAKLLNELQRHEYDNFYLGTPFRGLWTPSAQCLSPNGAPNKYGPGFNCTGFVASVFQRAGGDLSQITRRANAWGDVANAYNWRDALRPNTENYAFNSVNELLSSGKAEKGDVIYFEPDYTKPGYDCHIGFFWGSQSNENLMWHSYDRNIKSNIKSATPFTKIYLFKLGNDKNAVTYDKKMNHKRFIEKTNASVYSRPYQSGDKRVDTTKGLYHQEVLVSREVKNGHGTWQEITYKSNNKTKKGWIRSNEMVNVIDKGNYSDYLALKGNRATIYSDPYYPGVNVVKVLENKRTLPVSISQKATTGYGTWYKVSLKDGNTRRTGWMKSTDFAKTVNKRAINKTMTVNKDYGTLFDKEYTGPNETKKIGDTKKLVNREVTIVEEAYTGYGHWYRIDNEDIKGWIKETDVNDYTEYETKTGRMIINKNYGTVFDSPYVAGTTKKIDDLSGMHYESVAITAVAKTPRGTWYESTYTKNKKKRTGWIKSVDLTEVMDQKEITKVMTVNKATGSIFDSPYVGPDVTKKIGTTKDMMLKEITVLEEAKTGYGHWFKTNLIIDNEEVTGWIKVTDLEDYYNYKDLDTRMFINKNYGSVFDSPYVAGTTKKIDDLSGMQNQVITITAKATTQRGTWYQARYTRNRKVIIGWIKSVDLFEKINEKEINEQKKVIIPNGSLFDGPYLGPLNTQKIGTMEKLNQEIVKLDKVVTTGYGTWYHITETLSGEEINAWIKSVDLK